MEVDTTSPAGSGGKSVEAPVGSQLVVTPYNHSPSTPRGKDIIERACIALPSLIAPIVSALVLSPSASPSRVCTFMQGRTSGSSAI
jgi:hypothetical protein